jgi:hypothetical protein
MIEKRKRKKKPINKWEYIYTQNNFNRAIFAIAHCSYWNYLHFELFCFLKKKGEFTNKNKI